ncbi:class I SAM-dependent methyltransferase [Haliangium ochraceum]|uniref:Methyltransferase type 11 domain-containing protein n=1 Tax=Haliangium ochraceum (strain DSM 14365 / JCM 11303 / SMP-2) TaxID=502025 RepID=D0LW07_HALO1|nr:methyltransferase domain-containing protein [Haliangium ochraceum]ACY14141.1 hypothetical protein Hoch_1591 [Haliangium ochraceum DSM 14365]
MSIISKAAKWAKRTKRNINGGAKQGAQGKREGGEAGAGKHTSVEAIATAAVGAATKAAAAAEAAAAAAARAAELAEAASAKAGAEGAGKGAGKGAAKGEGGSDDIPARYLRLARRDWQQDLEKNGFFENAYRAGYSKQTLKERRFINFGPGSFFHKYWQNADRLYAGRTWSEQRGKGYKMKIDIDWNLLACEPVAVEDDSIAVCYCSHLVEHAWDDAVKFFFRDVFRILQPGGVFRVTCPDADLGIRAWQNDDRYFFLRYAGRPVAFGLLNDTSLVTHPENSFHLRAQEAEGFMQKFDDPYEALSEASRLSDRDLQNKVAAHVNWFNRSKLRAFLGEAGFTEIHDSSYSQSSVPVLRDVRYFDKTDPHMTCYIEARKTI